MGQAKIAMMEHQDNLATATEYLVSVGTLRTCEFHELVFDGDGDLSRLWPIAMGERNKGSNGRVAWAADMKAREFTDLLQEAYEQNCAESCGLCDKWKKE